MTSSEPFLYNSDLYEKGLLDPIRRGADELLIVSGYASPSMASQLLSDVDDQLQQNLDVHLIVGMTGSDGIDIKSHKGFLSLQANPPAGILKVSYSGTGRAVHTKLYVWLQDGVPIEAMAGSSNFTQNGFLIGRAKNSRDELLVPVPPDLAYEEWKRLESQSIASTFEGVEEEVLITVRRTRDRWRVAITESSDVVDDLLDTESVVLPLVKTGGARVGRGLVPDRSGLNWGQRPEHGRDPNQAYIPVPAQIASTGFFPPRGVQFLVNTTDGKAIIMVVAEDGDKALHSPQGNHLIGEYFRNRLGLPSGAVVTDKALADFGSRFVKFYKVGDESYVLDYSPDLELEGSNFYRI